MERDEYLPSRRVVAGIRAASAGFPLDLFVVFATWSPWARRVYKAFASSYKNGLQGVSTGFSAFPVAGQTEPDVEPGMPRTPSLSRNFM